MLAELLRAGRPLRAADIARRIEARGFTLPRHGPKLVADVLTSQWRLGRVERVRRGWYRLVPGSIPSTTLRRIARWETTPIEPNEVWHTGRDLQDVG